ncbi:MAG: hypothetical protein ACXWP4_04970 [Polyangiales bacterium]
MAIVVLAIALAVVLDLKRARVDGSERSAGIALACAASAVIAPLLPIAAILPTPVPAAGKTLASFDAAWPCSAPPHAAIAPHAIVLFFAVRVLVPLGVIALARTHVRSAPRPRALAMVAFVAAAIVLFAGSVRVFRGGSELSSFRTCGALTPESGAPREAVDEAIARVMSAHAPAIVATSSADPSPPWARAGLPIAIADRTARMRARGSRVAILDDDAAKAAVTFSGTPEVVAGIDTRGRPAVVLLEERANGTFALRVGRPVSLDEIGPLARAPKWPLAMVALAAMGLAVAMRRRAASTTLSFAYRSAPATFVAPSDVRPWIAAWLLVEAASSALMVLRPYA